MTQVLLVEDDPAIARSIVYTLEREGMSVTHCLLLGDARRQLALRRPDVVVMDIGLPDGSGLDLCREIRAAGNLPVLVLSAQGEEIDRVLGLELGADDYMTKPFSPRELLARLRSLLRRARMPSDTSTKASSTNSNPFETDLAGQRVTLFGQPLQLTRLEFGLLADLLSHKGRIRSRDALLTSVWGLDASSTDRTVDTHIKTLRAKLIEVAPGGPQCGDYIVTHRGMGYSVEF